MADRDETGNPHPGNAEEALKAFGNDPDYTVLNREKASFGEGDGNADAAIKEWGGVKMASFSNSILRQGKVELASNKTDSPTGDDGHPY